MEHYRTGEKWNIELKEWESIEFKTLIKGDVFRLFDDGERYVNEKDGNNVWIATGSPFICNEGVWAIDTLY